jgi:ubiquinone biosynthesis protein UbiJ
MADVSNELMLTILQGVQSDIGEMKKTLTNLDGRVGHIEADVSDLKLQFTYTLGLASGADFKAQTATRHAADVEKRVDELTARVEQLEKAH